MEGITNIVTDNVQQSPTAAGGPVTGQATVADAIVSETVSMPSDDEVRRQERRGVLAAMRVASTTEVPPEVPALTVDGIGLFALGDIHGLKGKQKCGKTTALKVCIAALLKGSQFRVTSGLESPRVLYLDTEQKRSDVKLIVTDVIQMTGLAAQFVDERLQVYALRRRDFNLLMDDMRLLIDDFQPQVVVVDGIVEFVASFNDESMAKQLIHELLVISEERRLAMVCVLHTNKADDDHNMRGHLGTMLAQKAGTVLECKKERESSVITVSCSDARHAEMPDWSIMFAADGQIVDADERRRQVLEQHRAEQKQRRQDASDKTKKERLDYALKAIRDNGGSISRKQLTAILCSKFELERTSVSRFITSQVEAKSLYEENKQISASPDIALAF